VRDWRYRHNSLNAPRNDNVVFSGEKDDPIYTRMHRAVYYLLVAYFMYSLSVGRSTCPIRYGNPPSYCTTLNSTSVSIRSKLKQEMDDFNRTLSALQTLVKSQPMFPVWFANKVRAKQ